MTFDPRRQVPGLADGIQDETQIMNFLDLVLFQHSLPLVLIATLVCVFGSWIAMGLLIQANRKRGALRTRWIAVSAMGAGSAVWCTHFTAMMAFEAGAPVRLDIAMTMVSLIVAVTGCGLAMQVAIAWKARFAAETGGALCGLAIAAMHYSGMIAYRVQTAVTWDRAYIAGSVVMSVLITAMAFHFLLRSKGRWSEQSGKLAFAIAIVTLHFTGMAALVVICGPGATTNQETFSAMGIAIAAVGMLTIGTGFTTHLIDARLSQETLEHFQQLALTDALTGLPNRVSFAEHLDVEIKEANVLGRKLAILGIDLDRFKEINDLRGHAAGDQALRTIARRLLGLAGPQCFVARLGGDEFAAVIRFTDEKVLLEHVDRMEKLLFEPIVLDDFATTTGASIGVALYPDDGRDRERLMGNADLAMYRAKADIGHAVCFFEARMDDLAHERHALAQDLQRAIERNELELHYQAQSSLTSEEILGYEALLRWNHPARGQISPAEFIPIAEETGSILSIGEWALRRACRDAAEWLEPHKIAVNISPKQFAHVDLERLVIETLADTGLPARRLELEITESTIISNKLQTLHMLRRIRALGVTVAIDDFGVGYSSLDTLRSFPFDKIKLDRSFLIELGHDPQAKAIVRAVLTLGKSLNIPVLAEGVESSHQLAMLKREGCDEAQGFLLGRPGPLAAVVMSEGARLRRPGDLERTT